MASLHAAHAAGSPAAAVDWQSTDSDAEAAQLELQKARRSSQLWSGGGVDAGEFEPESGGGAAAAGVHAPRLTA